MNKNPDLVKISETLKESINELLRSYDIANNGGIKMPEVVMIDLTTAMKLKDIIDSLSDIDDVVGDPGTPCPVESQNVVMKCRYIAHNTNNTDINKMGFLQ